MNRAAGVDIWAERGAEPWAERYEDLRGQVLEEGSPPPSGGWGYALVVRHGLIAWMKAWPRSASPTFREPLAATATTVEEPHVGASLRPQAIHMLVNMILGIRSEVCS